MLAFMGKSFLVVASLASIIVVIATLIRKDRNWADWSLIVGALLLSIGLGLTTIVTLDLSPLIERHGRYPCLGSIGLGAVLFAMGFFMDQLRHRAIRKHREQLAAMERAATMGEADTHG